MISNIKDFDYEQIEQIPAVKRRRGNPHGKKRRYKNIITAFDIEATTLPEIEQSFMYIFMFQFGLDQTYIGRNWTEFFEMLLNIKKHLNGDWLVIYVHNLSYEFQFLKGLYEFEEDEVFCTDSRKVLKCTMFDCIEFRCSYLLTNMSLDQFTYQMKIENRKLSGEQFDYSKLRFSDTVLSDYEMQYCVNDVQGLVQALYKSFSIENDNVDTVPLTSTGYVRRDAKKAMGKYNHDQLEEMLPDLEVYTMLREAFRGGNTHANRWYVGDIVENVRSVDRVSSYPDVMINCQFPMMKFYREPLTSIKRVKDLIYKHKKPVLMRICFYDLDMKDLLNGAPYLSRDKCRNVQDGVYDNGRILRCSYLETTLTDIDFKIVLSQYKWKACNPYEIYSSVYKPLPQCLKNVVLKYYVDKTVLKGNEEMEVYYTKSKNKLNACYGMTAQDPVKQSVKFRDGCYVLDIQDVKSLLDKSNKKAFLSYAWGVWVTAWARYRLQEVIDIAGHNFIYCDTDSVKYIGDIDISEYNSRRIADSRKNKAFATDESGHVHYMGVFENEINNPSNSVPDAYTQFKTLGAKKYVYEDGKGLHITIAGVNKKTGAAELGSIENFQEGFTFYAAGGTESIFNDDLDITVNYDGHTIRITDNIVIKPSMYTLGLTAEYKAILDGLVEIKYSDHTINGYYDVDNLAQLFNI